MLNKLATIEVIKEIKVHEGADRLELVYVLGFQLITEKALHNVGDKVVFIRTDSVLPDDEWAESFKKYSPNRIRAFNMRGEFTEGIIMPISEMVKLFPTISTNLGDEVSEIIGVTKFEYKDPQEPDAKASKLPYFIPQTDEIRWENMENIPYGEVVDITLKSDGVSTTFIKNNNINEFHLCGRGQELLLDRDNVYTRMCNQYDINTRISSYMEEHGLMEFALRGEVVGQGASYGGKNPHLNQPTDLNIFSSYNVKTKKYYNKGSEHYYVNVCDELDIPTVDLLERDVILTKELIDKYSNMEKLNGKMFEGVVVKYSGGSFKIINKYYDSKK